MDTIYKEPRIATLQDRSAPYRGEWIIYGYDHRHYVARHEVEEAPGHRRTVESVALQSLADVESFSIHLTTHGWSRIWGR